MVFMNGNASRVSWTLRPRSAPAALTFDDLVPCHEAVVGLALVVIVTLLPVCALRFTDAIHLVTTRLLSDERFTALSVCLTSLVAVETSHTDARLKI